MQRLFDLFGKANHELYLVGGAVRDLQMGVGYEDLPDLDFATNCTPDTSAKLLKSGGFGIYRTGWNYGSVGTVLHHDSSPGYPKDVQITTYRSEESYRPGSRHPQVSFGDNLEVDLSRRDLGINSMAMGPDGKLIDPHGGLQDIAERRLRVLGDPEVTLREDPLRILRVARFQARLGFTPTKRVRNACGVVAPSILDISRERWFMEMNKLLLGDHVEAALQLLYDTRVLGFILPEVAALVGFEKSSRHHHKDVWAHTKAVVAQAPARPALRWSALLHDVGKRWTRGYAAGSKVHFFRHEDLGAMMFEGIAHRFRFDNRLRKTVRFLIKHHLRGNLYDGEWTDSAVRRFTKEMGEHLEDLMDFTRADITSANAQRRAKNRRLADELHQRCEQIAEKDGQQPPLPKGLGQAIIDTFALKPGRIIGDLRKALEEAVIQETLPAQAEYEVYLKWLEESGLVPGGKANEEPKASDSVPRSAVEP